MAILLVLSKFAYLVVCAGHDQLPQLLVRDVLLPAVCVQQLPPLSAQPGLEAVRLIVQAYTATSSAASRRIGESQGSSGIGTRVYDLRVSARCVLAIARLSLVYVDPVPPEGKLTGHSKPDYACTAAGSSH